MDIAAYLNPNLLSHLMVVASGTHKILGSDSWEDLSHKIRSQPIDLAVVDPMADGIVRADSILSVLDEFPSVPVILYTQLNPENLQATVDLARAGVRHVLLFRFDDGPSRFLELIESQPGAALAQMLLQLLEQPLGTLHSGLRRSVERMFGAPGHFVGVSDLARSAKMSRRTIYRAFAAAGLATPRKVVSGARLLRAYAYMLEPGNSLEIAASKLGFEVTAFRRIVKAYFNTTPNSLKRTVAPQQFVVMLAQELYPGLGSDPKA